MLDVSVFRNLRFSAASVSVMFVFFALMGVMYFLTTYLQSVLGYTALEAGVRMVPIAVGLIIAARLSVALTERFGTKVVVAGGLALVGISLGAFTAVDVDTEYMTKIAGALTLHGRRHGVRDGPRHGRDHGVAAEGQGRHRLRDERRRPRARRHARASLCSAASSAPATRRAWTARRRACRRSAAEVAERQRRRRARGRRGDRRRGRQLIATANQAFVDAMTTAASIAAAVALVGAALAAIYLPSRAKAEPADVEAALAEPAVA